MGINKITARAENCLRQGTRPGFPAMISLTGWIAFAFSSQKLLTSKQGCV